MQGRLKELRAEIRRLENAKDALGRDGSGRRRPGGTAQDGRSSVRRRRKRHRRMDPREREAQALHAIRHHGAEGVSVSDLAQEVGVSRKYLASKILPPLDAQVTRTRGRVAAK